MGRGGRSGLAVEEEIWFSASRGTAPKSLWHYDLAGQVTPLLTAPGVLTQLAVLAANGKLLIHPAQQPGPSVEVPIGNPVGPILWQADYRHLYAKRLDRYTQVPAPVLVVDTITGKTIL